MLIAPTLAWLFFLCNLGSPHDITTGTPRSEAQGRHSVPLCWTLFGKRVKTAPQSNCHSTDGNVPQSLLTAQIRNVAGFVLRCLPRKIILTFFKSVIYWAAFYTRACIQSTRESTECTGNHTSVHLRFYIQGQVFEARESSIRQLTETFWWNSRFSEHSEYSWMSPTLYNYVFTL